MTKTPTVLEAMGDYKFDGKPSNWPECKAKIKLYCVNDLKVHALLSLEPAEAKGFNQGKHQSNAKLFSIIRAFTGKHSANIATALDRDNETNGIALWRDVCERFESEALSAYQDVEKTFTNFKIGKNQDAVDYLYECKAVHKQLKDLAKIVTDRDRKEHDDDQRPAKQTPPSEAVMVKRTLDGLQQTSSPEKFIHFASSFKIANPMEQRTFTKLMKHLREFNSVYEKQAAQNIPLSEATIVAMVVKILEQRETARALQANRAGMQPTQSGGQKINCDKCGGYGHLAEQCSTDAITNRCTSCRGWGHDAKTCPNPSIEQSFSGSGKRESGRFHAEDVRNQSNKRTPLHDKPCWNFQRGSCRFGDRCKYGHFSDNGNNNNYSNDGYRGGGGRRDDRRGRFRGRNGRGNRGGGDSNFSSSKKNQRDQQNEEWKSDIVKRQKTLENMMNANFTKLSAQIATSASANYAGERRLVPMPPPAGLSFGMSNTDVKTPPPSENVGIRIRDALRSREIAPTLPLITMSQTKNLPESKTGEKKRKSDILLDSGTSHHLFKSSEHLHDVRECTGVSAKTADGSESKVTHKGILNVRGNTYPAYINPAFDKNLMSISSVVDADRTVSVFDYKGFGAYKPQDVQITGSPLFTGTRIGDLFYLDLEHVSKKYDKDNVTRLMSANTSSLSVNSALLWHRRLAHTSLDTLAKAIRSGTVKGIYLTKNQIKEAKKAICKVCKLAKSTRMPIRKHARLRETRAFKYIYADLSGPYVRSVQGNHYILTLTCDYSRMSYVVPIAKKSDAPEAIEKFLRQLPTLVPGWTNQNITMFMSDNGGEFKNYRMERIFQTYRVAHCTTSPHTPTTNAVAERINRTMNALMRANLKQAGMRDEMWEYALKAGMWIKNRLPHAANQGITPYQYVHGEPPNLKNARVFGSKCYVHRFKHERKHKLSNTSEPAIFLGYPTNSERWIVYVPKTNSILKRRDVYFDESSFPAAERRGGGKGKKKTTTPANAEYETHDDNVNPWYVPPENDEPGGRVDKSAFPFISPTPESGALTGGGKSVRFSDDTKEEKVGIDMTEGGSDVSNLDQSRVRDSSQDNVSGIGDSKVDMSGIGDSEVDLSGTGDSIIDMSRLEESENKTSDVKNDGIGVSENKMPDIKIPDNVDSDSKNSSVPAGDPSGTDSIRTRPTRRSLRNYNKFNRGFPVYGYHAAEIHSDYFQAYSSDGKLTDSFQEFVMESGRKIFKPIPEPKNFRAALKSKWAPHWVKAMEYELTKLHELGTFEIVRYAGQSLMDSVWVFKAKYDPATGMVNRYRARLCCRGFKQKFNVHYRETYAPVARQATVRTCLAIAAWNGLKRRLLDIDSAFLHSDLPTPLYMKAPKGLNLPKGHVLKIKKGLYGAKQAARLWWLHFTNYLVSIGFKPNPADPCLMMRAQAGKLLLVPLYVDDCPIFGTDDRVIDEFLVEVKKKFKIKTADMDFVLGMELEDCPGGGILLHQNKYVRELIHKFKITLTSRKRFATPLPVGWDIETGRDMTEAQIKKCAELPYAMLVGSLMYAAITTRIDIIHSVVMLSRLMHSPTLHAWKGAIRVLTYLAQHPKRGIFYAPNPNKNEKFNMTYTLGATNAFHEFDDVLGENGMGVKYDASLMAFTDSDYANCVSTRRSVGSYVVFVCGSPVSWSSQRQKTVALSTCEAEFMAAVRGASELIWLKKLLIGLGFKNLIDNPPTLFSDNTAAIRVAVTEGLTPTTKHISTRHFWIREKLKSNIFRMQWVNTYDNPSDLLTKLLAPAKFNLLLSKLRVVG